MPITFPPWPYLDYNVADTPAKHASLFRRSRHTPLYYRGDANIGEYRNGRWRRLDWWEIADEIRTTDWMGVLDSDTIDAMLWDIRNMIPDDYKPRRRLAA